MKKILDVLLFILLSGIYNNLVNGQTLAFPGAEGYGKYASGGRGGRIIEVTNLEDADRAGNAIPGSLRAALATTGTDPVNIVFRVSGIIALTTSEIKCSRSNMTIAGQTAPGEGICIKNGGLKFSGSNLIIRYVRFRPGDELKLQPSALGIENAQNIIIDHCSFSWATEENTTLYDDINLTVQWCILSEALYNSYHAKGARGYAAQWGGQYSSYHHNLLAHHNSRSPRVNGSRAHDIMAWCDYRNNVIFNWGSAGAIYGGEEELIGGECKTNFVNNYYKPGPATPTKYFAAPSYVSEGNTAAGYAQWVFSGNYMEGITGGMNDDNWLGVDGSAVGGIANIRWDTIFEMSPIITYTAQQTYDSVLKYAGAILPIRDDVDERIVGEVKGEISITGDGVKGEDKGIIDSQTAVGGWPEYICYDMLPDTDKDGVPDEFETELGLNINDPEDTKVLMPDGYSIFEFYINSITGITGTPKVGINKIIKNHKLSIFPNPCEDILYVKTEFPVKEIKIIDFSGKIIHHTDEINNSLIVQHLKPGMYVIMLQFQDGYKSFQPFTKL